MENLLEMQADVSPPKVSMVVVGKLVRRWVRNHYTRRELRKMDIFRLKDIGVDPIDAMIESRKPFWR